MASTALRQAPAAHGGTAIGTGAEHSRHRIGDAVRAVRVYVSAAVEVAVLGSESRPH
ncbi:hypothetical protein [Actinacidiphila yeochonensis]|uniref:hypothetical protein n=1 Tax=Actinacidiphila yeochonensis TaxID=89050 RepID=UPI000ADA5D42|nr:hypothetical protein [Actinacidiphila yeochonensis]